MPGLILLTLTCPECSHRWTVEVTERYGAVLERETVCPACCAELGLEPEPGF